MPEGMRNRVMTVVWCTCHRASIFLLSHVRANSVCFLRPLYFSSFGIFLCSFRALPFCLSSFTFFFMSFFIHFVAFCLPSLSSLFLSPFSFFSPFRLPYFFPRFFYYLVNVSSHLRLTLSSARVRATHFLRTRLEWKAVARLVYFLC